MSTPALRVRASRRDVAGRVTKSFARGQFARFRRREGVAADFNVRGRVDSASYAIEAAMGQHTKASVLQSSLRRCQRSASTFPATIRSFPSLARVGSGATARGGDGEAHAVVVGCVKSMPPQRERIERRGVRGGLGLVG